MKLLSAKADNILSTLINTNAMRNCIFLLIAMIIAGCTSTEQTTLSGLLRSNFQTVHAGLPTDLYTLTNANGMEVCFTNFGGRIVSIMVPDKDNNMIDVCLGHDSIADYICEVLQHEN